MKKNDYLMKLTDAFYRIYNGLGYGFSREVYLRAFMVELDAMNIEYKKDSVVKVYYEGVAVGFFEVDFLVAQRVIVSIKADPFLAEADEFRLENVVMATCCEAGIVFNFGTAPEVFRKIGEGNIFREEGVPFSACA